MKNEMWLKAGEELHEIRKSKDISVFKARDELGVSVTYMLKIEKGRVRPTEAILVSLALMYGVQSERLLAIYGLTKSKYAEKLKMLSPYLRRIANERSIHKTMTPQIFESIVDDLKEISDKYNI